jgi:hypothetical protein
MEASSLSVRVIEQFLSFQGERRLVDEELEQLSCGS